MAERLPLGAVRTASGEVVVPASRRADGSERKPIRIRQGYVPQDEVPKYKTVAQREVEDREQKAAPRALETALESLSLESQSASATSSSSSTATTSASTIGATVTPAAAAVVDRKQRDAELKQELSKLNRLLKDIAKLEARADQAPLATQQQRKLERKAALQAERNEIIAELNGATIASAAPASAAKKTFVAIEM